MKLDIYPYTTQYKAQSKAAKAHDSPANSIMYELSTVIVHKGNIDSGHYVVYCRKGDAWFLFDDSKVVLVGMAEVLAAEAYLLFYMISNLDV